MIILKKEGREESLRNKKEKEKKEREREKKQKKNGEYLKCSDLRRQRIQCDERLPASGIYLDLLEVRRGRGEEEDFFRGVLSEGR